MPQSRACWRAASRGFEVVFLGSFAPSYPALELTRRTEGWPCPTQVFASYTSQEAIDFYAPKIALPVMPSRADNSPYTVYECLENAIPFIAADVGGVSELIRQEDRARVLVSGDPEEIADKLVDALQNGATPAQPRFDPTLADIDLLALHGNLVAEARLSRGRTVPVAPAKASIIVHGPATAASDDDFLDRWLARARSEGHEVLVSADSTPVALNSLARSAAHDRLLFCHRSVLPDAGAVPAMVATMATTNADAVVCGYTRQAADGSCESVPVFGGPPELSSEQNVYGTRLLLVGKESLIDAGGFSGDPNVAAILEWEFLNRLKASGRRVIGVPAPLASSATSAPDEPAPTPLQLGQLAEAWTEAVPAHLQGFMRKALKQEGRTRQREPTPCPRPELSGISSRCAPYPATGKTCGAVLTKRGLRRARRPKRHQDAARNSGDQTHSSACSSRRTAAKAGWEGCGSGAMAVSSTGREPTPFARRPTRRIAISLSPTISWMRAS